MTVFAEAVPEAAAAGGAGAAGRARAAGGAPGAVRTNRGPATFNPSRRRFELDEPERRRGKTIGQRARSAEKIRRTNYQPVILMEFVGAILLTAMTPVATKKDSQGLSPYAGTDIVKLAAITLVYLILAMMSVGGRSWGRVAAWLGGLILLTDGLYEAANIAQDLQVFGGGGESKSKKAGA